MTRQVARTCAERDLGSSDANEAVRVSLIKPGPTHIATHVEFHPKFTYPIFGEEERIFGYQDLDLHLRFLAHDLQPNIEISYEKRFPAVGETQALDLNKTLKEWLPSSTQSCKSWANRGLTNSRRVCQIERFRKGRSG